MKGSTLEKKNSRIGWTMVIIASVLILAFSYIPMVQAFLLSLKTGKGNNLTFGGVANYVRMLLGNDMYKYGFFRRCGIHN